MGKIELKIGSVVFYNNEQYKIVRIISINQVEIENLVNECIILGMILKTTKIDSDSWFNEGCDTCGYGGGNFTTITVKDLGVSLFED